MHTWVRRLLRPRLARFAAEELLTRRMAETVIRRIAYLPLDPDRPWVVQELAREHPALPVSTWRHDAYATFVDAWAALWA